MQLYIIKQEVVWDFLVWVASTCCFLICCFLCIEIKSYHVVYFSDKDDSGEGDEVQLQVQTGDNMEEGKYLTHYYLY